MASYRMKKLDCPCCGKPIEVRLMRGYYQALAPDLDGYPHEPAEYDRVVVCPSCGYASERMEERADPRAVEAVQAPEYQMLLKSPGDDILRRLRLAVLLDRAAEDLLREACHWLALSWRLRELGESGDAERGSAAECLEGYLLREQDPVMAIVLIDCLRQLGREAEAEETADALTPFLTEDWMRRAVEREKELLARHDRGPNQLRGG